MYYKSMRKEYYQIAKKCLTISILFIWNLTSLIFFSWLWFCSMWSFLFSIHCNAKEPSSSFWFSGATRSDRKYITKIWTSYSFRYSSNGSCIFLLVILIIFSLWKTRKKQWDGTLEQFSFMKWKLTTMKWFPWIFIHAFPLLHNLFSFWVFLSQIGFDLQVFLFVNNLSFWIVGWKNFWTKSCLFHPFHILRMLMKKQKFLSFYLFHFIIP